MRKHHAKTPVKICLTEVEKSVGDYSHPDAGPVRRDEFSPGVRDLPADLENLEKMNDTDDFEVMSIHS